MITKLMLFASLVTNYLDEIMGKKSKHQKREERRLRKESKRGFHERLMESLDQIPDLFKTKLDRYNRERQVPSNEHKSEAPRHQRFETLPILNSFDDRRDILVLPSDYPALTESTDSGAKLRELMRSDKIIFIPNLYQPAIVRS